MLDHKEELAALRQRMAAINRKFTEPRSGPAAQTLEIQQGPPSPSPIPLPEQHLYPEEYLAGEIASNALGTHYQTFRLFEHYKQYGSVDVGSLTELPSNLLGAISAGEIEDAPPEEWAFLDTETTGLAGGSGTYAFLIGVGHITREGFRVRQFFLRDYGDEPSQLAAVAEFLEQFRVLVTYNGKSFDLPLLETRYRMTRQKTPFARLGHLDLLHGARRLWKLRYESCRLVDLENQVLGLERQGDLPGEMIPYVYFEYLRSREISRVVPILHHNVMDIATLACLTSIVPWAFHQDRTAVAARFHHGAELLGLARWLRRAGELEQAAYLYRMSIERGLKEALLYPALWDLGLTEKKLGRVDASLALFTELVGSRNPHRVEAYEELAKYYEHQERNAPMALEMTQCALRYADTPELRKRWARLAKRAAQPRPRRLAL